MKDSILKQRFKLIVSDYIFLFAEKHDVEFEYWVADEIGEIAVFADYFIDLRDIRHDLDNEIPKDIFFKWYDQTLSLALENKPTPNYKNFIKLTK